MSRDRENVIIINKVKWNVLDRVNFVVERLGQRARLIWKTPTSGKMLIRDVQNGRFRSEKFTAASFSICKV